jgi:hypothetical protein
MDHKGKRQKFIDHKGKGKDFSMRLPPALLKMIANFLGQHERVQIATQIGWHFLLEGLYDLDILGDLLLLNSVGSSKVIQIEHDRWSFTQTRGVTASVLNFRAINLLENGQLNSVFLVADTQEDFQLRGVELNIPSIICNHQVDPFAFWLVLSPRLGQAPLPKTLDNLLKEKKSCCQLKRLNSLAPCILFQTSS